MTSRLLWAACLAVVITMVWLASPGDAQPSIPRAGFDWSMEPRFGLDIDGDGRIEIENTREYAHNRLPGTCPQGCPIPGFVVELRASPTPVQLGLPTSFLTYEWRLSGRSGVGEYHALQPVVTLRLPEGEYDVDLRVTIRLPWGRVTQRARGDLVVDDVVVVALGDSYASGEGNPDAPAASGDQDPLWADSTDVEAETRHAAAHRSAAGWPARVALALEDASQQTSVTFVHLASSGARIDRGVLRERSQPPLPAQLDELASIAGGRAIDILLVQVGGNDVGFSRLIRALVDADPQLDPICYHVMIENAWAATKDGVWDRGVSVRFSLPFDFRCEPTEGTSRSIPGLDGLDDAFGRLAVALEELDVAEVVLVEYPDPTGSPAEGEICREIVGDVTPPFGFHEVDEREQAAGVDRLLTPLNTSIEAIADQLGWRFVGGVAAGFAAGHGYCSPWPDYGYPDWYLQTPPLLREPLDAVSGWYRPPGRYGAPLLLNDGAVSWYRTAAQSAVLQGPVPRYLTAGTLHPNEQGHLAIAGLVLAALMGSD